jgi:hypothetical protein
MWNYSHPLVYLNRSNNKPKTTTRSISCKIRTSPSTYFDWCFIRSALLIIIKQIRAGCNWRYTCNKWYLVIYKGGSQDYEG